MRTRRAAWFAIGVVIMALVVLGAVTVIRTTTAVELIRTEQIRNVERSKETNENTEALKEAVRLIISCTTPEGECSQRGQRRTGEAVASINDVIIAAAACAKLHDTETAIRACVVRSINGPQGRR